MVIVLMGVAGSGKTTLGQALAAALSWPFVDADDFHPPHNVQKMAGGQALTDEDRMPWLAALRAQIVLRTAAGHGLVLACSALKRGYRQILAVPEADVDVRFVYLRGSPALLRERLRTRAGHFMKDRMLDSQFEALEEPTPAEAEIVDVSESPEHLVAEIRRRLHI